MDVEELVNWRRDLHQIPELGLKEYQTKAYLKKELEKMGYHPSEILETGLYIYIDQGKEETIAFRTDMDALPITEKNDIPFKSKHEGCMHACGHDGHMTAMLGFAKKLSEEERHFDVNLLLIFQPAEEAPGAAKMIVASGLLKKYHVKAIYGIHLMPTLPEGTLASKAGGLMAECGEIDVTIHGKDAHAGMPHLGVDSIMIASILLNQYQQILTRMKTPFEPAIINIGEIHGGEARNSVASTCELHGTVRTYSDEIFDLVKRHSSVKQYSYPVSPCEVVSVIVSRSLYEHIPQQQIIDFDVQYVRCSAPAAVELVKGYIHNDAEPLAVIRVAEYRIVGKSCPEIFGHCFVFLCYVCENVCTKRVFHGLYLLCLY